MLHSWKFWAVLLGIASVVGLLAYGFTVDPKLVKSPLLGKKAPAFTVKRLGTDGSIALSSFKGKPVLLNFWASWCVACREEAIILQAAYMRYERAEGKLKVVGIAIQDTEEKAIAFARKFGKTYSLGLDNDAGDISLSYGLYGVPETFFIDAQGVVRYKHVGAITAKLVDREVGKLIGQSKGARP